MKTRRVRGYEGDDDISLIRCFFEFTIHVSIIIFHFHDYDNKNINYALDNSLSVRN